MVGQQRLLTGGMSGQVLVTGWDIGAGLAMARALGVNMLLAAEMLPIFEQIAVRAFNSSEGAQDDE
jgi:hypothetical protein